MQGWVRRSSHRQRDAIHNVGMAVGSSPRLMKADLAHGRPERHFHVQAAGLSD